MVLHQILPAASAYSHSLCDTVIAKNQIGLSAKAERELAGKLSDSIDKLYAISEQLRSALDKTPTDHQQVVTYYHDVIVPLMEQLRDQADILESITDKSYWPYPTYSDLLFY